MAKPVKAADDEYTVKINGLMLKMEEATNFLCELEAIYAAACSSASAEIAELEKTIDECRQKQDALRAEMVNTAPDVYDDLLQARQDVVNAEQALRSACHNLPAARLSKTQVFEGGRFRASVSKATTTVTYKREVLNAYPDLVDLTFEGEPLVTQEVNPVLLDRLVVEGLVDKEAVAPFRVEAKTRSPQVKVWEEV